MGVERYQRLAIDRRVAGTAAELSEEVGVGFAPWWRRGGGERERRGDEAEHFYVLRICGCPKRLRDGAEAAQVRLPC